MRGSPVVSARDCRLASRLQVEKQAEEPLESVYSIGVLFKKETFRSSSMLNMLSISFGVAIAAYGEARFDIRSVALQLAAVAFEATRLVLIQILLTSKGISLNPITSLYYVVPCCLAFLFVPWVFIKLPKLRAIGTFEPDFFVFGTNSLKAKEALKMRAQADEEAGSLLQERDLHGDRKNDNQA